MPGWLVCVSGKLTDRVRGALSGAGMTVTGQHDGGTGPGPANMDGFTVRVEAADADQASVKVGGVLVRDDRNSVRNVRPSGD